MSSGLRLDELRAVAQLACDLAQAGALEAARTMFDGLTLLDPSDASAWAALGTVHQKLGHSHEAERAWAEALRLDPDQPVALGNLGELRLGRGDPDGERFLRRAAAHRAPSGVAAVARAKALIRVLDGRRASATR
jgi:Flp pilus assembly protein TadD